MTTPTLTALIVDDEPVARRRLRRLLAFEPDVEISGECSSAAQAKVFLARHPVDLLFLDIQMPDGDGFSVLSGIVGPRPSIVFVTAFDEHAVRAFEVEAVDYLLKPFDRERVASSVARVRRQLAAGGRSPLDARELRQLVDQLAHGKSYRSRILIRAVGRVSFVPVEDVHWFEADGNYVRLHTGGGSPLVRETLSRLERELDPEKFVRIHRSAMVNLACVRELEREATGDHTLVLGSGARLTVSRSHREAFERAISGRLDALSA
jgi:two-component system LytT family response regulator